MIERLGLMNSPFLVRHQCQDNGQWQAGDSTGSEASCIASRRLYPGFWAQDSVESAPSAWAREEKLQMLQVMS